LDGDYLNWFAAGWNSNPRNTKNWDWILPCSVRDMLWMLSDLWIRKWMWVPLLSKPAESQRNR